jgi:glycosyltransferase involved in cell wall biosynthesis
LTIAIPTYNRADRLEAALKRLSANCLENTTIIVIDNASTDHTPIIVESYLKGPLKGVIKYSRNSANIGMLGNIIRCFEQATTEWLWILGDDDQPVSGATVHINDSIQANPEAIYLNFVTTILDIRVRRETSFVTSGLREFIADLDCFSNLVFISSGVYRVDALRKYIERAYRYNHTMVSFLALIFSRLHESPSSMCVFSNHRIVNCRLAAPSWSYERYCNHAFLIVDILPTQELRKRLFDKMNFIDPFAPSFSLRRLHQAFLVHDNVCSNYFARYASISSLMGAYNRPLILSYLCSRLLFRSPFMQLLNGMVKVSKKPIPLFGRQINRLLDLELGVPRPRDLKAS